MIRDSEHGDQVPPHDRDAERALLAGIMRDPDRYLRIGDSLDAADFYTDAHQKIYLAVEAIHRGGDVPDLLTVASELRRAGHLADMGGYSYLADLFTLDPTGANAQRHAGIVREHAILRAVLRAGQALIREANNPRRPARQILDGWAETLAGLKARADRGTEQSSDFEFVNLSTMKAKPQKWAVPGRIPKGCVTLIAAYGGLGKSTLVRSYIAAITTGRCAFGQTYTPERPGNVLMVAAEDDYETAVIPHLLAEGADLSRIDRPFPLQIEKGKRTRVHLRPEHIADLQDRLKRMPTLPHTLYIDPIASFSGRAGINDAKATEVRSVIDPLSDMAQATGMAVIVIAHMNKGATNGPAANRVAGSRAYVDAVRLAYIIGEHPDDPDNTRVLALAKPNIIGVNRKSATFRLEPIAHIEANNLRNHPVVADLSDGDFAELAPNLSRVVFGTDESLNANDLAGDAKPKDGGKKLDQCIEWLREYLKEFAYPSVEIEAAGTSQRYGICTIRTAKKRLKDEGLVNEKDGLDKWWSGMGPSAFWTRRPDPTTQSTEIASPSNSSSPSLPSSPSTSSTLFTLSKDDEEDKGDEGNEHDEGDGGSSRSVTEHLEDEKSKPKRKRKPSKRKPKAGKA